MLVEIEKSDHLGRGVTKVENKICFVKNALPRETVEIKITKTAKNYLVATVTKIIKKSKDRVEPICPYNKSCGGCNLSHISFEKENEYKKEKVAEIMKKFANISPCKIKDTVYDKPYHYRNKITMHQKDGKIGLYQSKSNSIIPINYCHLINEKLNDIIPTLISTKNEKEIILKIGNKTGEILNSAIPNQKIISCIGDKKYQVSEKSFFQINHIISEKLYEEIKNIIKTKDTKNVLDLYCGTGTIGIYISKEVEKVLGIESCKEAIMDAEKNKVLNKATNCNFKLGKVESLTKEITDKYDTAIIDPPRSGLDKKVTEKLLEITPNTLIYVSCDPVTLARDLELLQKKYTVEYIRPYNMFPRTYHVECLSVLSLKRQK